MRTALIAIALLLSFSFAGFTQDIEDGGSIIIEEPVGWGCDNITSTAECWACCYEEGDAVFWACMDTNTQDFCLGEKRAAIKACKDEDC